MTCRECEALIPKFIDLTITKSEYIQFINHINNCSSCKDDAEIEFLVSAGLKSLEKDEKFVISEEFLNNQKKLEKLFVVQRRKNIRRVITTTILYILLFLLIYILVFYIWKI